MIASNQPPYINGSGYSNPYPGYERNGSTSYQPQIQQQQQSYQPQPQPQHQPQPQQQSHQQQLDSSAGWTDQQRRDYDQQWAEYQRASQEYAQVRFSRFFDLSL